MPIDRGRRHCAGVAATYTKGRSGRPRRPSPRDRKPMLNSLEVEGRPQDVRVVVAMSGGVDSSVTAALLRARGLRCRRGHPAALRPWRRDPPQGRLLRRPGHPRRPHGGGRARHPALRAQLREPLQGSGDRPVRRELCGRRDAGALRRLQPGDQVPRPPHHRPRPRRAGAGDRPLRRLARGCPAAAARSTAPATRTATRATSCSPPRASRSISCAFRSASSPRRRPASSPGASICRSPTSPTARTSASCRPGATPT